MKYCYNSIKSSKNGFTLIELAVVVGIIATITIVSFKGLLNMKLTMDLNRTARQLEATLKNCQSKAMYTGSYYKMDFYPSLDRYRVYCETDLVQDNQLVNINLHYTNFTNHKVYFYKTGVPSMGGTVTLKTNSGKTLYVIMTPVTARTRISKTPPANW